MSDDDDELEALGDRVDGQLRAVDARVDATSDRLEPDPVTGPVATANLISAIEGGTDPSLVNPRLNQLRVEHEMIAHQLANLDAPDRLSPADIDTLMTELGGLPRILGDATPPEKTAIYQALGLRLVYQPDQKALVATADLGRVFSRVGGGT